MTGGFRLLLRNVDLVLLEDPRVNALEDIGMGLPLSHPIHISELFTPYAIKPTDIPIGYNVKGLAKLLLFNDYARAQSKDFTEFVLEEAMRYNYTKKPHLSKVSQILMHLNSYIN